MTKEKHYNFFLPQKFEFFLNNYLLFTDIKMYIMCLLRLDFSKSFWILLSLLFCNFAGNFSCKSFTEGGLSPWRQNTCSVIPNPWVRYNCHSLYICEAAQTCPVKLNYSFYLYCLVNCTESNPQVQIQR
jgi:hypothetical protein